MLQIVAIGITTNPNIIGNILNTCWGEIMAYFLYLASGNQNRVNPVRLIIELAVFQICTLVYASL